jgi:tripartite ATP-independent transporter DctM subunit
MLLVGLCVLGVLGAGAIGIPLAYAMLASSFAGTWWSSGFGVALGLIGESAFGSMREYVFIVIPLFDAMGFLVARSGAAEDLFAWVSRALKRVPGKLAVGTVAGNAIFATITGIGAVSAVTFSRIAYPQMRRHGYCRQLSFGAVAGSCVLSLFLPPAVLVIIWAILTEQSVGKLFMASVVPGLLLAGAFGVYCVYYALRHPDKVPRDLVTEEAEADPSPERARQMRVSLSGIVILMGIVLGGIWGGVVSPAEASAFGLMGATILFKAKGRTWREWLATILDSGKTTAPLLLLIIAAQAFSKLLAYEGITSSLETTLGEMALGPGLAFIVMVLVWLLLGSMLDSTSIMLLTAPIFFPLSQKLGMDPIGFTLSAILFIEAGLLHPPFGLAVYLVKAAINDNDTSLADGFWGTLPFCFITLGMATVIACFPGLVQWLRLLAS